MNAKFKPEQKVLYKGQQVSVIVSQKNFATKEISYMLEGILEKVPESELQEIVMQGTARKELTKDEILAEVRELYKKEIGQPVPSNRKNNIDWMQSKIQEAQNKALEQRKGPSGSILTWEQLKSMTGEEIAKIIADKGLDIDVDDYTPADLAVAVAQELEIEVTE